MALEQKLSLRLSQKLVMTPSLQQAIKLLHMTRLELETALTEELVENPVLEEREDSSEGTETETPESEESEPAQEATAESATAEASEAEAEADDRAALDEIDLDAFFRDSWESPSTPNVFEAHESVPLVLVHHGVAGCEQRLGAGSQDSGRGLVVVVFQRGHQRFSRGFGAWEGLAQAVFAAQGLA